MKKLFLISMILMTALAARSQDLLCSWHFDTLHAAPRTIIVHPADSGLQDGAATFYLDGTNGSSLWTVAASNSEVNGFGGTTLNDGRTPAFADSAIALANSTANGKSMVIKFSMTGYENPILTYAARGTATGFNTHYLEYSTDGITFTPFDTTAANITSTWIVETIDLSAYNVLDEAANVYVRIIFNGASSSTGNNRLDNITVTATSTSATDIIPPTVLSATATSLSDIWVRFSEPVSATAELTANYSGVGAITSATRTTGLDSVHVVLTTPLIYGVKDTICISSVEDIAGNPMATSQCFEVVYGTLDVTPPTVIAAWAENLSTVKVKFSEEMDNTTAEDIINYTGLAGISTATLNTTLDTVTLALSTNLISGVADTLYVQDVEDTAGNAMAAQQMFVLFLDTSTTIANIVITEIMYNPAESGTDSTEFIEFLNYGSTSVNLINYTINYGVATHTITTPIVVNPGERFLVSSNAAAASNFYGMPFYQGSTTGLSNSGTFITIKNSSGVIVDSVMYDDAAPWTTAADEGGYSLSLCDPSLDNNNGANWGLGTVFFGTVNTHDVYADPGQGCVVPVDVTPPVVDTAIAIDLNTIKVIFNEAVDNITAEDIINYTGLAGISTATLNSAMDTVTLALSTPLVDNVADTVCIANVEDTAGNAMTASQCIRVIFSTLDIIPPTVLNAWPEDLATVKVVYSEAVDNVTAETTANYTGLAGIGTATLNTTLDTVTLALSTHLISGVADTLYVENVEDIAGNAMAAQQMFILMLDTSTGAKHLVITEIMFNPPESGTDSLEFIEIYNNDVVSVDLNGYVLRYGTSATYTFGSNVLNPGEYILVAPNATKASNFYSTTFLQGATTGISNSAASVWIKSPTGLLVDSLRYDTLNVYGWPSLAEGQGYSMSLCDPNIDNSISSNWELGHIAFGIVNGKTVYADPGQGCSVANDTVPPVATHAWLTNFTTVKVRFNEDVDLTSAETEANYTGLGTISNALLNTSADTVTLTLATPMVSGVTDTLYVTNVADTAGNVMSIVYAFPLMLDTTSTISALVISEIMYNPPEAGIDSLEFVEIYNNDAVAVDLLNYKITWGTSFKVFDVSYVINPGEYAIIAPNKAAADAFYGIVSIQGPTGGISNSGTSVKLNSPSGLLVDSLTYGNAAPWPTEANGLGASLTLCDVDLDNTDAANWSASVRFVGVINSINVYADPDTTCVGDGIAENVFNSVNVYPNPANDVITIAGVASADRIEIYNNMGMLVLSRNTNGDETITIETAELSNGLYYINVRMNDGAVETKPVVIIK